MIVFSGLILRRTRVVVLSTPVCSVTLHLRVLTLFRMYARLARDNAKIDMNSCWMTVRHASSTRHVSTSCNNWKFWRKKWWRKHTVDLITCSQTRCWRLFWFCHTAHIGRPPLLLVASTHKICATRPTPALAGIERSNQRKVSFGRQNSCHASYWKRAFLYWPTICKSIWALYIQITYTNRLAFDMLDGLKCGTHRNVPAAWYTFNYSYIFISVPSFVTLGLLFFWQTSPVFPLCSYGWAHSCSCCWRVDTSSCAQHIVQSNRLN